MRGYYITGVMAGKELVESQPLALPFVSSFETSSVTCHWDKGDETKCPWTEAFESTNLYQP